MKGTTKGSESRTSPVLRKLAMAVALAVPAMLPPRALAEIAQTPPTPPTAPLGNSPAVPAAPSLGLITPEMRAHDPRLERKVTLNESALCLGELIDRLAEQAKVPLDCPDDEPVSGEPVTLFIKERPLADVLNALYYLFSYRGAEWQWQRTDEVEKSPAVSSPPAPRSSPVYGYRFAPTKAAIKFAASRRAEIQAGFERQVEEMIACLGRPDDELKKDPRPFIATLTDPQVAEGVAALAEGLNADQRRQLLHGSAGVTLTGASLGPMGHRLLERQHERDEAMAQKFGSTSPRADYTFLHFDARRSPSPFSFGFYPSSLMITVGNVNSASAFSIGGASDVETEIWRRMDALWPKPNGDASAPLLPAPWPQAVYDGNIGAHAARDTESAGQRELKSFAQIAKAPVLARLTFNAWPSAGPGTRSAADYIRNLRTGGECGVTWRDGMLLICRHQWVRPRYTDPLVPWSILRRLRADIAADPQRLLPVEDLFVAAARLTPAQLWRLRGAEAIRGLEAVSDLRDLLAPLDRDTRRKERFLGKGLPVASLPPSVRSPQKAPDDRQDDGTLKYPLFSTPDEQAAQYPHLAAELAASPNAVIRLRVTDATPGQPPRRRVELVLSPSVGAPERVLAMYEWQLASEDGSPESPKMVPVR